MSRLDTVIERWLLPGSYYLRGRALPKYRRQLEASQWWSADRLRDFQWQQLQLLLDHVFAAPYYQQKFAAAGIARQDIRDWADFQRLPTLSRDEVNQYRAQLRSTRFTKRLIPHATGGSTGKPTRFDITWDSYDWRTAASQRAYSWAGCRWGQRTLYLWGAPVRPESWWRRWKKATRHVVRREHVVNTFAQTTQLWQQVWQTVQRFRPRFMVGYVSSLEQFARFLADQGRCVSGVQAVITAAEPVDAAFRGLAERRFQAPVFNVYGSREFMSIAAECCEHQGLHVNAENLIVETKKVDGGDEAELLVTDLHNYGMPLVRYEIGDVGSWLDTPCPCGRGLPRLACVQGRVLDLLEAADGRRVSGEFLPHLVKEVDEIDEYQARQISPQRIDLHVVLRREICSAHQQLLDREFRRVLGDQTQLRLVPVRQIEPSPSGKRRVTIGLAR